MYIYLIKRGPRPSYHEAPYHPVIICAKRGVANWEAGCTGDRAWVWERITHKKDGAGFLLVRWNGFDIDYGNVVHDIGKMPDGTDCCFVHPHKKDQEPWSLLPGSVWWDDKPLPADLKEMGVVIAEDDFSKERIACDTKDKFIRDYRSRR